MEVDLKKINDNIITKFKEDEKKTISIMAKNGFVTIDGVIYQYSPANCSFVKIGNGYYNGVYNSILHSLGNYWGILTPYDVENILQKELPSINKNDLEQFYNYLANNEDCRPGFDNVMSIIKEVF